MNFGINKRVDELGRVVIPKSIRNVLRIDDGDILNIGINGNKIELYKQNDVVDNIKFINNIYDSFLEVFNEYIIITDREKVILSNLDLVDLNIDISLKNIINKAGYDFINIKRSFTFGERKLNGYFYVYSINNSLSNIGSIVLYSLDPFKEINKDILKLIGIVISKYLG